MMRMANTPCRNTRIGSRVVCRWNPKKTCTGRYAVLRLWGNGRCAQINWPTSAVPESLSSASPVGGEGREKRTRGGEREREKERKRGRRDVDRTERREGEEEAAASRIQRIGASPH